jgi:hypothetical protein
MFLEARGDGRVLNFGLENAKVVYKSSALLTLVSKDCVSAYTRSGCG